jgi:hypothetical protein
MQSCRVLQPDVAMQEEKTLSGSHRSFSVRFHSPLYSYSPVETRVSFVGILLRASTVDPKGTQIWLLHPTLTLLIRISLDSRPKTKGGPKAASLTTDN